MIISYIHESIQAELEKRRRALARESVGALEGGSGGSKEFNKYSSRTPYVIMASNLKPAEFNVAIGGGSHFNPTQYTNPEKFLKGDADTIGPRTRKTSGLSPLVSHMHGFKNDGTGAYRHTKSKGISPIPGIKDISVEYKGGYKGIREATVNWGVSSLEDLEFYTPHFLAIGRSVALEWGWTMLNADSAQKFITYGDSAIKVDNIIFTNPSDIIIEAGGNLDGIGGVVTNFSFKLNDDGGFDCTTTLNALGVNFFGGDSLDSSGEEGLGLVLSEKDKVTTAADITTTADRQEALLKIDNKDHTNIIEELINLPTVLQKALGENKGDAAFGLWLSNTDTINFFKYQHHLSSEIGRDFMIRWGWLEDNIFSKYTAAKAAGGEDILFNFRSIDEKGESIKISYNEHLTPINPFRSIIFSDSTYPTVAGGDFNYATDVGGAVGRDDGKWKRFEPYFTKYMMIARWPQTRFNNSGAKYGKMRNIYVSLTDVMESFGFNDPEYIKTLLSVNLAVSGGGTTSNMGVGDVTNITVGIGYNDSKNRSLFDSVNDSYYANSSKIDPPKTMESAINILLKKINRNFHNYWKFTIVSDTETADNIRIIDENYVAPDPTAGPEQYIDYTRSDKLGIYKFPSFTVGSTVKSQTLEFKIPDAMKTVAMYGTNTPETDTPSNPDIRRFKALGVINKNPFLKSDGKGGTHMLSDLKSVWSVDDGYTYGNSEASGSKKLKINGNPKDKNMYKYVKLSKDGSGNPSNSSKQATKSGFKITRTRNLKNIQAATGASVADLRAFKDSLAYYIVDSEANNVILKAEAVKSVRSMLGLSGDDKTNESYLIPAELGLEIDGIAGIKPGNICHTDYIQRIYNERKGKLGPSTFFQIFGITQKVSDDGWTTSLETKMRVNGNALSGVLTGSFDLDMEFGTPVEERQKAANTAKVQAAANVDTAVVEEAAEEGVSVTELSGTDSTPDVETAGSVYGEGTKENSSLDQEFTLERKVAAAPVTTAVTGNVEYDYSEKQNDILYKARPDLRWKNDDGGWIVASQDARKKAWDELHKRDVGGSIVAKAGEAAQEVAKQAAMNQRGEVSDTQNVPINMEY